MTILKIVEVPAKILTSPTRLIKKIDAKIRKLVFDMEETLISQVEPQGVGLAATQVGLDLSLFIMKPSLKSETEVCINPQILKVENKPHRKDDMVEDKKLEGCLSIPRIWGPINRAHRILLRYEDLTGATTEKWFTGFKATIVQHEMDHLSGILFTQRSLEQKTPLYEEKDGELEKMKY